MILPNSKKLETVNKSHILNIYSGDRNLLEFPKPNDYSIRLLETAGKTFKNVVSVRLLSGIFPDVNDITQKPYLVLAVKELKEGMNGTNNVLKDATSIIQFDRPLVSGYFLNVKTDISQSVFNEFSRPVGEISRISIELRDINGALFDFGTDVGTINPAIQHLLTFEIVTKEPLVNIF